MGQSGRSFRYRTRVEYEREMSRMLTRAPEGRRSRLDEEEYDSLLEEYLEFCSEGVDA